MMKKSSMFLMVLVIFTGTAYAGSDVSYEVYQDGDFSFEYPDWKKKKPDSDIQILRFTKGASSIMVDVYDADINSVYDFTVDALRESGNLIEADEENYEIKFKMRLVLFKLFVKRKFVAANDKTYSVSFGGLSWDYKKRAQVMDHVLASAKSSIPKSQILSMRRDANRIKRDEFRNGIYSIKMDGTGLKRLYASHFPIRGPEVSPDGKKIVFYHYTKDSNGDGVIGDNDFESAEMAAVNMDGTGFETLTQNDFWDLQPNWTSDGRKILFVSNRDSGRKLDLDLFEMDLDTRRVTNITNTPDLIEADPDCRAGKVVFTRFDQDSNGQSIWIMNEGGSNQRRISFPAKSGKSKAGNLFGVYDPALTHDGSRVVFWRLADDSFKIEGNAVGK